MSETGTEVIIRITRDKLPTGNAILGNFVCNGLIGYTLEDNNNKLEENEYRGNVYYSPKFKKNVIALNDNDTKRKYIQIHHGNFVKDAGGSILVGTTKGIDPNNHKDGVVWKSNAMLTALVTKCGNKQNIKVIIERENNFINDKGLEDDEKKIAQSNDDDDDNDVYIDRVFVIRCKVKSFLPSIGGLAHSALLISTKCNKGYYVLEYSKERKTQLYPVKFEVITTYHDKYYQDIKLNGTMWTKQLNGSAPIKQWTIEQAKQIIIDAFKDDYAISKNKCCHIAQQIVRKAMGLNVDKAFDINNYPSMIKQSFSFAEWLTKNRLK